MTAYIVPGIIAFTVAYGVLKKVDVYDAMREGIKEGLTVCKGIFPAILVMLTAVTMLRESGFIERLSFALMPFAEKIGIPENCLPLALLRPFTGGGALSIGSDIINTYGPDSTSGRVAAVMLGASETSFYTLAVYSAYLGIKNTRYTLFSALMADLAAFVMAGVAVRLFM